MFRSDDDCKTHGEGAAKTKTCTSHWIPEQILHTVRANEIETCYYIASSCICLLLHLLVDNKFETVEISVEIPSRQTGFDFWSLLNVPVAELRRRGRLHSRRPDPEMLRQDIQFCPKFRTIQGGIEMNLG